MANKGERVDYERLAAEHAATSPLWDTFVRAALVDPWLAAYEEATPWETEVIDATMGQARSVRRASRRSAG